MGICGMEMCERLRCRQQSFLKGQMLPIVPLITPSDAADAVRTGCAILNHANGRVNVDEARKEKLGAI